MSLLLSLLVVAFVVDNVNATSIAVAAPVAVWLLLLAYSNLLAMVQLIERKTGVGKKRDAESAVRWEPARDRRASALLLGEISSATCNALGWSSHGRF